tara:strand:+ start:572 stop:892 length:321 start_codon:yes stop_codon:yes gene_type:complete
MPIIRKPSSASRASIKKTQVKQSVDTVRQPTVIKEMGDTSFGTLDESKDGLLVSYDSVTDKFVLISSDNVLQTAVEDNALPDEFITQLEQDIDLATQIDELDGGGF